MKKLFAIVLVSLFATAFSANAAEKGTLKNTTQEKITYQAGYANPQGFVSWQTYTIAPGEYHTFTIQDPKNRPLQLQWDLVRNDGKVTMTRNCLKTAPNGYTTGFFFAGNQVWVDTSGNTK